MRSEPVICRIDPLSPNPGLIRRAARIITDGGVVIVPTRSLYGLAVDAGRPAAVARLFELKARDRGKPLPVLIGHEHHLHRLTAGLPARSLALMRHFWPGDVTFVVPAGKDLMPELTGGKPAVGIRLAAHPVARALIDAAGRPVTGTSANLSGRPGAPVVTRIDPEVSAGADLILDAGRLQGGTGSTVVDLTGAAPVVLRHGNVGASDLLSVWQGMAEKH